MDSWLKRKGYPIIAPRLLALLSILVLPLCATAQTIIIDDLDAGFSTPTGTWTQGTTAVGRYLTSYSFATATTLSNGSPTATARWTPTITTAGFYNVSTQYPQGGNRSPDARFRVVGDQGTLDGRINQQTNGGSFLYLGRYHFAAGSSGYVELGNDAQATVVLADAVKFEYAPSPDEIRAFWTTRFEWPSSTTSTAKANIDGVMNTAFTNNFNTVLFQVRGQMDVHYPSPYEPWASNYNWQNPGWDPLAYAINSAHAKGIELHAYYNTHTLSQGTPPSGLTPPHPYYAHGPGTPAGQNWLIHDENGNEQASVTDGYWWISPGIPEASWWTRRGVVHLAKNYNVDGFHFDRIRTPGPQYSHDPIAVARFSGEGNPDGLDWGDFMRSQITRDLRNIYGELRYHKPLIKLSSSPIGISRRNSSTQYQGVGNAAYYNYYQDAWAWANAHVQDFVVPQIYWEVNSTHPHEKLLTDWISNATDRFIVGGSRTNKTISANGPKPLGDNPGENGLLTEQRYTRVLGGKGHTVFSFTSLDDFGPGETLDYWTGFKTFNYDSPATAPVMAWKTSPSTGFITGYIRDALGNPVVDARVNLAGDTYNYLSAYDGFFAILDVPAGAAHTLDAFSLTNGSVQQNAINVAAGTVTSLTLTLSSPRGVIDFKKPSYHFSDLARVRVYDGNLAGSLTLPVLVTSTAEPVGETVILDESTTTPGLFEGDIQLQETASNTGDARLRALPAGSITAFYTDANDGNSNIVQRSDTVSILTPADVIVESKTPLGTVTAAPVYQEFTGVGGGSWTNTETYSANAEVIKSLAPGLSGQGGRYISTGGAGSYAIFTPTIMAPGFYNVYITLPNEVKGPNNHSPGASYLVTHDGGTANGTFDLSSQNAAIRNQWYLLASNVKFAAGTSGTIRITNNHAATSATERFSMDAIKLVFVQPVPVSVTGWQVE